MIANKINSYLIELKSNSLTSKNEALISFQNLQLNLNHFKALETVLVNSSLQDLNFTLIEEILKLIEIKLNQTNQILNQCQLMIVQISLLSTLVQFISKCVCIMIKNGFLSSFVALTRPILIQIEQILNQKNLSSSDVLINLGISWSLLNQNILNNSLISLLEHILSKHVSFKIQLSYLNGCLNEVIDSNLVETICNFKNGQLMNIMFKSCEKNVELNVIQAKIHYQLTRLLLNHNYDKNKEWLVQLIQKLQTKIYEKIHSSVHIQNISFDSLHNLIILDSKHNLKYVNLLLADFKSNTDDYRSTYFHVFSLIIKVLGMKKMIILFPDLINRTIFFLNNCNDFSAHTIDLIIEVLNFNPNFADQLLKSLSNDVLITYLFPKIMKKSPNLMQNLASSFIIHNFSIDLEIRLKTLQLISFDLNSNSDKSLDDLIRESLNNFEESIQVCSASLIIDNKKSTEPILSKHLTWLQKSFPMHLKLSQHFYQKNFISLSKKLLNRLVLSLSSNSHKQDRDHLKSSYIRFIQSIIHSCLLQLHGACNANQRYLSFQILKLIVLLTNLNVHFDLKSLFLKFFESQAIYLTFFNCLIEDTRDDNKLVALDLIFDFVKLEIIPKKIINLFVIKKNALLTANSINPCDCSSSVYLFKLLVKLTPLISDQSTTDSYFSHLVNLINLSQKSIEQAQQSLINAAVFDLLHNKLACIRGLIEDFDWNLIQFNHFDKWKALIEKIIEICFEASTTVAPIVCNNSPEGHLLMDTKSIDKKVLAQYFEQKSIEFEKKKSITSQMLLICGWKTIKESTSILSNLCFKIKHEQDESLLNCSQIVSIIEYFIKSLKEIVHRGAFEQAHVGFSLIAKNLWTSFCFCFKSIQKLLNSVLDEIGPEVDFKTNTILTRRSGGLPLIIQAIVSSEPNENQNLYLNQTISKLVFVCKSPKSQDWKIIHSLNILSALVRDHRLSSRIDTWFEDCLIICFEKISSSDFAISNSASFLLVSLINKIFGVSKFNQSNHKKNFMSSKHFFLQFPSLNKLISLKLKDYQNRHLYFILLILLRLQPSSRESEFQLTHFLPDLENISTSCRIYRIRELSSKVVAQISSSNKFLFSTTLHRVFALVNANEPNLNLKHGIYSIINESIKLASTSFLAPFVSNILHLFECELNFLKKKLDLSLPNTFSVNLNHYYLIILSIQILLNRSLISFKHSILFKLENICFQFLIIFIENPRNLFFLASQNFLIQLFYTSLCNQSLSSYKLIQSLKGLNLPQELNNYKFQLFRFVSDNLLNNRFKISKLYLEALNDFELNVETWTLPLLTSSTSQFNYENKINCFLTIVDQFFEFKILMSSKIPPSCSQRNLIQMLLIFYSILTRDDINGLKLDVKVLLKSLLTIVSDLESFIDPDTKTYIHLCISSIFYSFFKHNQSIDYTQFYFWSCSLESFCEPESSDFNRFMVAECLDLILPLIVKKDLKNSMNILSQQPIFIQGLIKFFRMSVNLIQDNEIEIRKKMYLLFNTISTELSKMDLSKTNFLSPLFPGLNECFQTFYQIFEIFNSTSSLIHSAIEMIIEQNYTESNQDINDEGLFNKSKLNMFKDELYSMQAIESNLINIIGLFDCTIFHEKVCDNDSNLIETNNLSNLLESSLCISTSSTKLACNFQVEFKVIKIIILIKLWLKCSHLCEKCNCHLQSLIKFLNHLKSKMQTVVVWESWNDLKKIINSEKVSKNFLYFVIK